MIPIMSYKKWWPTHPKIENCVMWAGDVGPWEQTPRWHWRYWFGWTMRRYIYDYNFHIGDDWWQYGRTVFVAREILREKFDVK